MSESMSAWEKEFLDWVQLCLEKYRTPIAKDVVEKWLAWYRFLHERMPELAGHEAEADSPEMKAQIRAIGKRFVDEYCSFYRAASEVDWAARRVSMLDSFERDMIARPGVPFYANAYRWLLTGKKPKRWSKIA